ncbi:HET-domain-containing protein [Xylaria telfairii]|nr:HET-domain-containing protein [Xylaria telfairii]
MRLLHTRTLELETFVGSKPKYDILSHTWGDDELLFDDIQSKSFEQWKDKEGARKVLKSAKMSADIGIDYIWIDTCCIDKSSSSELSEAINSMFNWYRDSHICYAYLSDVLKEPIESLQDGVVSFEESRWFTRGWTLQELIAPTRVHFYDKAWSYMGGRARLAEKIHSITNIAENVLRDEDVSSISGCSVHTKMVWASRRATTRAEDRAYSLMGLFNVNMPLLYGEGGERAFERLQDEIIKCTNDQSILLHGKDFRFHPLAMSPDDFTSSYTFVKSERDHDLLFQKTRDGIDVSLGLYPTPDNGVFWGIIEAYFDGDTLQLDRPAFLLNWAGNGSLYQRKERAIYRIRHGDEGQMEVIDETGQVLETLKHGSVRREVVQLYSSTDLIHRTTKQQASRRILLRSIRHKGVSSRYKYHVLCPKAQKNLIYARYPHGIIGQYGEEHLVAYVLLRNVGPNPGSPNLGILIFQSNSTSLPGGMHLHLVDSQSWLEEDIESSQPSLPSVVVRLSSLPIVIKKFKNASVDQVADCIKELGMKYDKKNGTSIVTSDKVRINARIREGTFLEDKVYHLHVYVDQRSSIP